MWRRCACRWLLDGKPAEQKFGLVAEQRLYSGGHRGVCAGWTAACGVIRDPPTHPATLQVHANCRLRRIYFSDRLYSEAELPPEFKVGPTPS